MLTIALFLLPATAAAQQETPAVDVAGGYSYFNADAGEDLHGWDASVTANINDWFGVEFAGSGHYASDDFEASLRPGAPVIAGTTKSQIYTFMAGPRVSFRGERVTPYAHALLGGVHRNVEIDLTSTIPEFPALDNSFSNTDFGLTVGGGVDLNVTDRFAIRLVQADWVPVFDGGTANNARISTGVVFRFGSR
jgi:opacity protein-like surface antigen